MKHVFFDTNIYLELFEFEGQPLNETRICVDYFTDKKKAVLWLPEQVKDEVSRNRARKVIENIEELNNFENNNFKKLDDICMRCFEENEEEFNEIKKKITDVNKFIREKRSVLKKKLTEESLKADELIQCLFSSAKFIAIDDTLLERALNRNKRGNPPYGMKKYGDAIIWEALLEKVPTGEDLCFVGKDHDFFFEFEKENVFLPFLSKEWEEKKQSKIKFYKGVGEFVKKEKIPGINYDKIIKQEAKIDEEKSYKLAEHLESKSRKKALTMFLLKESLLPLEPRRISPLTELYLEQLEHYKPEPTDPTPSSPQQVNQKKDSEK